MVDPVFTDGAFFTPPKFLLFLMEYEEVIKNIHMLYFVVLLVSLFAQSTKRFATCNITEVSFEMQYEAWNENNRLLYFVVLLAVIFMNTTSSASRNLYSLFSSSSE